jgi:hypothetical protein
MAKRVVTWGSLGVLLALTVAFAMGAAAPEQPSKWAITPMTFCRYDVDVGKLKDPYRELGSNVGSAGFVCPFVANRTTSAVIHARWPGERSCAARDFLGLQVTAATHLSQHQFDQGLRCTPAFAAGHLNETSEAKDVFLIHMRGSLSAGIFSQTLGVAMSRGLPVLTVEGGGVDGNQVICLGMLKGAGMDPLVYLKAAGVKFPADAVEERSNASDCNTAAQAVAGVWAAPEHEWAAFTITLLSSSASPTKIAFSSELVETLKAAGITPEISADRSFRPLGPDDNREIVLEDARNGRAGLELKALTPHTCNAVYLVMKKLDAFIPAPDDESPTIVAVGSKGGPPHKYAPLALTWVHSSEELCAALSPAYGRLAAANR